MRMLLLFLGFALLAILSGLLIFIFEIFGLSHWPVIIFMVLMAGTLLSQSRALKADTTKDPLIYSLKGLVIITVLASLPFVGAAINFYGPPPKVIAGNEIKEDHKKTITSLGLLGPNEKFIFSILMHYGTSKMGFT